jgi:hypothetical protein
MYKEIDCRYGNVEKLLNKRFKVHHLYRDFRHDDGDDAGYLVAICQDKKDTCKFYLHIILICQYTNALNLMLNQADMDAWFAKHPEDKDSARRDACMPDFIECDSIEDAQKRLNGILKLIDNVIESDNGDWFRDWGEFHSFYKGLITRETATFLSTMFFPYSEYPEDRMQLSKLSTIPYVRSYDNKDIREWRVNSEGVRTKF